MKGLEHEKICPQCGAPKMKDWQDLTDDQKLLVEKLPLNTDFSPEQRKKHRFCERCFYEDFDEKNQLA
jgi:ribosomal protein S27AE